MAARFAVLDGIDKDLFYLNHLKNRNVVIVERGTLLKITVTKSSKKDFVCPKKVWWLLNQISDRLEFPTDRNNPISPMNRLLITLRAYATGAFNILIGGNCNIYRDDTLPGRAVRRAIINEYFQ